MSTEALLSVSERVDRIAARRKYLSGGAASAPLTARLSIAEAELTAARAELQKSPASRLAHLKVQTTFANYRDLLHKLAGPAAVRLFLEQKALRADYDVGMAVRALT